MTDPRGKLTYANVISTLALFLVLSGGAAYAASHLGKNSVGSKQIKNNAVSTAKIKNAAVTGEKLAPGSVGGAQLQANSVSASNIQAGSLTGGQINQSTLTSVRASNVSGVALNGNCTAAVPFPSGVSASITGTGCRVTFPFNIYNCAVTATPSIRTSLLILVEERTVQTLRNPNTPDSIVTDPAGNGSAKAESVDLIAVC
ncbi:MAG: hypothetical protein WB507_04730 [Solirubrobacterales bacterium]